MRLTIDDKTETVRFIARMSLLYFVVRSVGERTHESCVQTLNGRPFAVVSVSPFLKAVKETFYHGSLNQNYKYLVALDADVLLRPDAMENLERECEKHSKKATEEGAIGYRFDFRVKDKFRGIVYAGVHVYLNQYSSKVLPLLENIEKHKDYSPLRPESSSVRIIRKTLLLSNRDVKNAPIGLHDYHQYYSHLLTKYFNRAVRDQKNLETILQTLKQRILECPEDLDYLVALKGLELGKSSTKMRTAKEDYFTTEDVEKYCGFSEKPALQRFVMPAVSDFF